MSPASTNGDPAPNGHYAESAPTSSTPTIDVSFDRPGQGDCSAQQIPPVPLWPHRLSASFSAMADQIAAASQALALVPSTAFSGSDVGAELATLKGRLEGIERTQERMMVELEALKKDRDRGDGITTVECEGESKDAVPDTAAKLEELEKKLNELSETVKIDQQRLPVRLHNSRATIMKATLKTPITAGGKPAAGFPTSRGEFEHITKERYEGLLKAYGLPLKGDTDAKREALRTFSGIPQDGQ
ncbi:hypothetical protein J3R83DRAFT_11035 [Lanmaoa asiatica]|nr:hypothetical protein J3R83DRAFT_11035 [Lanmaoa asiatica]